MAKVKVVSWNIWGGQHLPEILDSLSEFKPDIVCLQEVVRDLDGRNNTAEAIARHLGHKSSYFTPTYEIETAKYYKKLEPRTVAMGNAIVSKNAIQDFRVYPLSEEKTRFLIEALIPANGEMLHIFSTHLLHTHQKSSELQELQAKRVAEIIPKKRALLGADLNATPKSTTVKILKHAMMNTDSTFAPTWSVYPEGCPVCKPQAVDTRLDYLFVTKDLKFDSFKVHESKGSDHLPISVVLEV